MLAQTHLVGLVLSGQSLDFDIIENLLPIVGVHLALGVPNTGAGLGVAILDTGHVVLAVDRHVYLVLAKHLFVGGLEILQHLDSHRLLEVETVFPSKGGTPTGNHILRVGKGHIDPVVGVVSPRSAVSQNLRLAAAALTPKQSTRVVSLEAGEGRSSDFSRSPVVIAEFVVTLHVQFIFHDILLLEVGELTTQSGLVQLKLDQRYLYNFCNLGLES